MVETLKQTKPNQTSRMADKPQENLPKIIWQVWLQGWDTAPQLVQDSRSSWINRNPGWEHRALTRGDLDDLLSPEIAELALSERLPHAAASDLIRLDLLRRYGGVWADATTFCVRPLDDWLLDKMQSGLFAFKFENDRRPAASWFLASVAQGKIVSDWHRSSQNYWHTHTELTDYYWVHLLLAQLIDTDPEVGKLWQAMPHLPAKNRLHFKPRTRRLFWPASRKLRACIAAQDIPVAKLTLRPKFRVYPWSTLNYLSRTLSKPL